MDIFLARQPIFDADQRVYAYEVLYRSGTTNAFDGINGDEASAKVIINTFQTFGIDRLTNNKPVFINFTESFINDEMATLFPKDSLVVEVLESVNPGDNIVERCRKLKELGYTIALDDFVYSPEYESLLSLVDIIKIDFLISKKPEIEGLLRRCRNSGIKFLAEKVETHKEFEYAKRHGFKLFQGYFFSKPEVVKGSCLSPLKVNCLQLIKEVNREEINFNLLSNIISRDISMTYNLLRLVNSAAFGFRSKVTSVKQAIVVLGEREIRKWMTLVALNDLGKDKPDEIVRQSLIRARFAELVAEKSKFRNNSDNYFVAGLFSMLDVLLDRPLGEILEEIHAPEGIMDCMLDHDNTTGSICKLMMSYEACEWQEVAKQAALLGIKNDVVVDSYVNALIWYSQIA